MLRNTPACKLRSPRDRITVPHLPRNRHTLDQEDPCVNIRLGYLAGIGCPYFRAEGDGYVEVAIQKHASRRADRRAWLTIAALRRAASFHLDHSVCIRPRDCARFGATFNNSDGSVAVRQRTARSSSSCADPRVRLLYGRIRHEGPSGRTPAHQGAGVVLRQGVATKHT